MDKIRIRVPRKQLVDFCRKNHIKKPAFFGLQEELSRILGYRVDLNTPGFLSKHFRDQVIREAQVEYVAA